MLGNRSFRWSVRQLKGRIVQPVLLVQLLLLLLGSGVEAAPPPRIHAGEYLVLLDTELPPGLAATERINILQQHKQQLRQELQTPDADVLHSYSHLPMLALRLPEAAHLQRLKQNRRVRAIYPNHAIYSQLSESLPLIRQTLPDELGYGGQGTSIAIVDTGLDYTRAEFGHCTAPGSPADCRVAAALDIAAEDGFLDDNGHGTHVAAIAAAVAGEAKLVALDVFTGGYSSDAEVISAINWVIAHRADYNIVAINLSLGDGNSYTTPCDNWRTNPYLTPIAAAKDAGIVTIIAAGNEGYSDALSRPACTPAAVSVGAVYDAAVGGISYGSCTDTTTAADQIACFSNSSAFLTLWAPGSLITTVGMVKAGTSQAAPHVAGAAAALRAAYPLETIDQTVSRLTSSTTFITDPRNGAILPRLNEQQALAVDDPDPVPGYDHWAMAATALGLLLFQKKLSSSSTI